MDDNDFIDEFTVELWATDGEEDMMRSLVEDEARFEYDCLRGLQMAAFYVDFIHPLVCHEKVKQRG